MTLPRLLMLGALGLAGCAESIDERPATFEYIVNAVLAPSCGTATCHNAMTRRADLAFDSVEGTLEAFRTLPLDGCVVPGDPCEPEQSQLIFQVTIGEPRMPIDSPLPEADIELIRNWIRAGSVRP